jgi:hypothetical protein
VTTAAEEWAMRSRYDGLLAEMDHLAEAWLDARAGGRSTAAPEAAWKDADRERRKLERELRKLGRLDDYGRPPYGDHLPLAAPASRAG